MGRYPRSMSGFYFQNDAYSFPAFWIFLPSQGNPEYIDFNPIFRLPARPVLRTPVRERIIYDLTRIGVKERNDEFDKGLSNKFGFIPASRFLIKILFNCLPNKDIRNNNSNEIDNHSNNSPVLNTIHIFLAA